MNILAGSANRRKLWFSATVLMFLVSLGIVESFQGTTAEGKSAAITYSNGVLNVTIPYQAPHAGTGQLTVEILNPEDEVLGRVERRVAAVDAAGWWQDEIKLTKALAVEDLVWHRLRYRFVYSGSKEDAIEGTESISQILRMPVIHILGQQSYLAGGQAAVRVIVTDSNNETIAGGGSVRIEWADSQRKWSVLFAGQLNRRGTTEAQFRFPAGSVGTYSLRYVVDTPIGTTEFTQQVRLEDKVSILLTTEKPHLPTGADHPRAGPGARPRGSSGRGRPQADVRSGGLARQQGLQESHADGQVRHRIGGIRTGRRSEPGNVSPARADGRDDEHVRSWRLTWSGMCCRSSKSRWNSRATGMEPSTATGRATT